MRSLAPLHESSYVHVCLSDPGSRRGPQTARRPEDVVTAIWGVELETTSLTVLCTLPDKIRRNNLIVYSAEGHDERPESTMSSLEPDNRPHTLFLQHKTLCWWCLTFTDFSGIKKKKKISKLNLRSQKAFCVKILITESKGNTFCYHLRFSVAATGVCLKLSEVGAAWEFFTSCHTRVLTHRCHTHRFEKKLRPTQLRAKHCRELKCKPNITQLHMSTREGAK